MHVNIKFDSDMTAVMSLGKGARYGRAMLTDAMGRRIDTLRISVTDRCNFRCRYCMPPEGLRWIPRVDCLSFEDITLVARAFLELGGRRLRITGGEPLLRRDLPRLVGMLAELPGLQGLGLTTNGSHLKGQCQALWNAGLRTINISLDSLNPCKFEWVTRSDQFQAVWGGVHEALDQGLEVKLNTVVLKGITEREVVDLVDLAIRHDIEVRFIEFMPLCGTGWRPELCFPIQTVRDWVTARWPLSPQPRGSHPAESFMIAGEQGRVGFIASLSDPFCARCSRIRLSANGVLYPCLFSKVGHPLKDVLQDEAALKARLQRAVWGKPAGHGVIAKEDWEGEDMPMIRSIGG